MEDSEYVKQRLDNQITWYDSKSSGNQRTYRRLRGIEIGAAAAIPLVAAAQSFVQVPTAVATILMAFLGSIVTVCTGFLALGNYHENWIEYRTTCETLKKEKFMYLTRSDLYSDDNRYELLVSRVESLISRENTQWSQYVGPDKKGRSNDK